MKSFFLLMTISTVCFSLTSYPVKIKKVSIPQYEPFLYAFWQHPYLSHEKELQTYLTKHAFDAFKILPADSVVIDIGAHTGDTSVAYARALGRGSTVLAFEASKLIYEVLKKNAELTKNIIPHNLAITMEDGNYEFLYTDEGCCNGGMAGVLENDGGYFLKKIPIKVRGVNLVGFLDSYYPSLKDKVSFIKIDTEGYDRFILSSLKEYLKIQKPIVQVEIFPTLSRIDKEEFFQVIEEINYECYPGGLESFSASLNKLDKKGFLELGFSDCTLISRDKSL